MFNTHNLVSIYLYNLFQSKLKLFYVQTILCGTITFPIMMPLCMHDNLFLVTFVWAAGAVGLTVFSG